MVIVIQNMGKAFQVRFDNRCWGNAEVINVTKRGNLRYRMHVTVTAARGKYLA